jgi:hypothetical protein
MAKKQVTSTPENKSENPKLVVNKPIVEHNKAWRVANGIQEK